MLTALALPDAFTWPFTCQPVDCAAAVRELAQARVATTAAMRSRVAVGGCWRERRVGFMGNTRISSCRSRRWRLKHGSSVAAGGDDSTGVTRCAVRRQRETGAKFANHEYASDDARHATTFDETNPIAPRRHRHVVTGRSTAVNRPRLPAAAESRVEPARARRFGMQLRRWFRAHGRDLPWRRTRDPYRILVSELMLQQTQVSRVVPKYAAFLETFPTLHHIARARPRRVTEAWAGLGYYARARNLHALARVVTDGGRDAAGSLPPDAPSLRALPGVGAYTAGAVSSFAYERRAELVDTNVARVLQRVFAPDVARKTGAGQKVLWAIAKALLPRTGKATWTHNQALMELGALVCTARVAHCHRCPVADVCATFSAANVAPATGVTRRSGRIRAGSA